MTNRMSKVFRSAHKDFGDLSAGFDRQSLSNDHVLTRYGISGVALTAAYDQVQSLLAIATSRGIYVLGQHGVEVFFKIKAGQQVAHLQLHRSHLIAIDEKNILYTWALEDKVLDPVATQSLRGVVTTTYVEPSVSWLFIGLNDGTVVAWDIEGEQINSNFKIKNQYFDRQEDWRIMGESYAVPRYHISPVLQLCMHPTDLGMLMITYPDGACLYSLKQGKTETFYECILPMDGSLAERKPALTCSTFSPDGEHVSIGCVDGTFAFFAAKDGELPLQVRNLELSDINLARRNAHIQETVRYDPIISLQWCCRVDPKDTFLLVAGGMTNDIKGISVLDYGTPPARTQGMSEFFATPQRHKILPVSRDQITTILPIGTASPYYLNHDPQCLLMISVLGDISFLQLTDGQNMPSSSLPSGLSIRSPRAITIATAKLPHVVMSSLATRSRKHISESTLLFGGANRDQRFQQETTGHVLCTIHEDSSLKVYDIVAGSTAGPALAEVDLSLTMPNTLAQSIVFSNSTGEFAVASESGLVVLYKFSTNNMASADLSQDFVDLSVVEPMPTSSPEAKNMLCRFDRAHSNSTIAEPICVISARRGEVTAMCVSDVGLVAIGYESGFLIFIDLRGPAIFYTGTCDKLESKRRSSVFRKATTPRLSQGALEYATAVSFFAMTVEGRMSLVAVVGTSLGRSASFEFIKEASGVYTALLHNIETSSSATPVRQILGCNQFGENIDASGFHLTNINTDAELLDCVIVVTDTEVVSSIGLEGKNSNATFRGAGPASSAKLVNILDTEVVVLAVCLGPSIIEVFSIPNLQPLGSVTLQHQDNAASQLFAMDTGDVLVRNDKYSFTLMRPFAAGLKASDVPMPALFDALKQASIPRPTISNWAWVTGTQYIKPADLDLIISGGVRPLSKRAMERLVANEQQQALLERQAASRDKAANRAILQSARNAGGASRSNGRNAFGDMQQGGQERGERVSQVNDVFENISKASGEWLSEVDKLTSNAKKSAGKAALRSFLGF